MANYIIGGILILLAAFGIYRYVKKMRNGCCGGEVDTPKRIKAADKNLNNYPICKIVQIEGMSCNNCAINIENSLNSLDGVYAKVELKNKLARVYMKSELDSSLIKSAVFKKGYSVKSIS